MEWFEKHTDTVIVLGGIVGSLLWMNHKFNNLEREILIIKTVMLMKGDYPRELAKQGVELK